MDKDYDFIIFISKYIRVANFVDIIETATIFLKQPLKTQKSQKNRNYVLK